MDHSKQPELTEKMCWQYLKTAWTLINAPKWRKYVFPQIEAETSYCIY